MVPLALGLSGLLACLVRSSTAVPLRPTPAQLPARQGSGRRCNAEASEPGGLHLLVDNSRLNAKTRGLSFRFSKDNQDRDPQAVALWGTEVVGVDQGDGWVKVGDCFLPTMLNDVPTLRSLAPEGAAELSQHGAARVCNEVALKQAVEEAAEVTEAVTAKLKLSEAQMSELRAQLERERVEHRKQLEAVEAKNKELQMELKKKISSESPVDGLLLDSNEEVEELNQLIDDLRSQVTSLNSSKTDLEVKLRVATERGMDLQDRLTKSELTSKRMEKQVNLIAGASGENVARRILELENTLEEERHTHEANVGELVRHAQKRSVKNTKIIHDMGNLIESLQEQVEALQKQNATQNATQAEASSEKASSSSVEAAKTGDFVDDVLLASMPSSNQVDTTDVSELQRRTQAAEQSRREMDKKVASTQKQCDNFIHMAMGQVKDIQQKLFKNNHTFQLRFQACERRNTELEEDCEIAKQQLSDELDKLRGVEPGASAEANLRLVRGRAMVASSESLATLQATNQNLTEANQNLTEQIAQLHSEKAAVQAAADEFRVKFERKQSDQEKTSDLVDDMQEKFALAKERIDTLEQQLAKASSSGAAAPAVGIGGAAALLLTALAAA